MEPHSDETNVANLAQNVLDLIQQQKFVESIAISDKAISLAPNVHFLWYHKGLAHALIDEPVEAIRCYDKTLKLDPTYTRALNNKGDLLNSIGQDNIEMIKEAIDCLTKSTELNNDNSSSWNLLGNAYGNAFYYEKSVVAATVNEGENIEVDLIDTSMGRYYAQAQICYENSLKVNPDNSLAWSNHGRLWAEAEKYSKAMTCYDKAIALDPAFVGALNNKAHLLHLLKRDDEAIECIDKAIEHNPTSALSLNNKANLLHLLNRDDEARIFLEQANRLRGTTSKYDLRDTKYYPRPDVR